MLSKELLEELKTILKEDYGLELTPIELADMGAKLVAYFSLLAKIDTSGSNT